NRTLLLTRSRTAQSAEPGFSLTAERALGMSFDQLREVIAGQVTKLIGLQGPLGVAFTNNVTRRFLLALALGQIDTALARNEQDFVDPGKRRVAGDDFLTTLQRRDISLAQFEILTRDLEI